MPAFSPRGDPTMDLDSIAAECGTLEEEQQQDDERPVHADGDGNDSVETGVMDVESGL